MTKIALSLLMIVAVGGTAALAQADFVALPLEPGDRARVISPSGVAVAGVVTEVTPDSIRIGDYAFKPSPGLRIDRTGDSLLTGGTLFGVGFGALVGGSLIDCPGARAACTLGGMVGYGSLAALLDYFHKGHTTVFRGRPRPGSRSASTVLAPVISRDRKGVMLSFRY